MASGVLSKRTRDSFLLSLILHAVMVFVFGFVVLEHHQEKTRESIAVEMVSVMDRTISNIPHRILKTRESIFDFHKPKYWTPRAQFEQRFAMRRIDPAKLSGSHNAELLFFPELATSATRLRPQFSMPLPNPSGTVVTKPGGGSARSAISSGAPSAGLPDGAGIFEVALYWIARNVISKNKTGKEDIVFLIDASGSMEENIFAVARYLSRMIDVFEESKLDYTIGVIKFNRVLKDNDIKIYEQTKDSARIRAILRSIKCHGDENTLDAVESGLMQVKFRNPVDKTFVLVTDEAFKPFSVVRQERRALSRKELLWEDFLSVVQMCKNNGVKVSVMGTDDEMHKLLAKETGGLWFQIPQRSDIGE